MRNFLFLARWFFGARFLGRKRPLQTVLFLTERCNLSCRHCTIYNPLQPRTKSWDQVMDELAYSYALGSRFVDFEGGEPTLWTDGEKTLNDLCDAARKMGFFSTTVTTNAQRPFGHLNADSVWVSLDGLGPAHDDIRGAGAFDRLAAHIASSGLPAVSVNMVINARNHASVEPVIAWVRDNPAVRSVS